MNLTEIILPIMKNAAQIMLSAHDSEQGVNVLSKSGDANFVTVYDKATQDYLIDNITAAIPNAKFVAEEQDNDYSIFDSEYVFVIDPIDGTTNFIHEFSHSSISVACISRGKTVFGAVYNPYLDEMFHAELGGGAYKNGKPISVSDRNMKEAIFSFGSSPYYKNELGARSFDLAHKIFCECADLRRTASAALDFCYVAAGRIEFFFELRLSPWDYAAGELILTEAGGIATDMQSNPLKLTETCSILASNKNCYGRLLEICKNA